MRRSWIAAVALAVSVTPARASFAQGAAGAGCDADNVGLTLPAGFCAGVFASGVPSPRHMAVADNGDVFVISNSRGRGGGATPRGVFRLRDANRDGRADSVERVADGTGGGLFIAHGALYTEGGGTLIVRRPFQPGTTELTGAVDTIVTALPAGGNHFTRDFVVRGDELFVNVGSSSNACEQGGGRSGLPRTFPDPCTELETRAGIWRFSATQKNQVFSPAARYATGVRNGTGIVLNRGDNQIYATQHGRDNLGQAGAKSVEYNAENPGEELFLIREGGDYGWPYCYYSHEQKQKVTAPEYGGDGVSDGRCTDKQKPVYAFPGHWAPNAALFYAGQQFPAEYRSGVFVAFHGSWNRAPLPQAGFNVTFLPMRGSEAAGEHRVFAGGFNPLITAGATPGAPLRRPTGLAEMRDGSLLVSDDAAGSIIRIVYTAR